MTKTIIKIPYSIKIRSRSMKRFGHFYRIVMHGNRDNHIDSWSIFTLFGNKMKQISIRYLPHKEIMTRQSPFICNFFCKKQITNSHISIGIS